MEENIKKELIKARNILKNKFKSIKMSEVDTSELLENTFKPITKPLENLVKISNNNNMKIAKRERNEDPFDSSTPLKKIKKEEYVKRINEFEEEKQNNEGDSLSDIDEKRVENMFSPLLSMLIFESWKYQRNLNL